MIWVFGQPQWMVKFLPKWQDASTLVKSITPGEKETGEKWLWRVEGLEPRERVRRIGRESMTCITYIYNEKRITHTFHIESQWNMMLCISVCVCCVSICRYDGWIKDGFQLVCHWDKRGNGDIPAYLHLAGGFRSVSFDSFDSFAPFCQLPTAKHQHDLMVTLW